MKTMRNNRKIFLSVIIPAYNEAESFKKGYLEEVAVFLNKKKFSWEVILVDDGSRDRTYRLLQAFCKLNKGFKAIKIPHGGKAAAVSAGVFKARGEIVLFADFDQSTPISSVEEFLKEFKRGADVVIADRYSKGARRTNDSFVSLLRSKVFNFLVRFLILRNIGDTQCGFKAFRGEIARSLFKDLKVHKKVVSSKPFMGSFDVELLFLAEKEGLKIVSIPVVWRRVPSNRLTVMEPIKMAFDVLKIRVLDLMGKYSGSGVYRGGYIDSVLPVFLILVFTFPVVANILRPGYFAMHDDMQAMRQLQMDKCFSDWQIPCRFVPDLGYGYGYPLFNYYPPMPYLLGEVFVKLGFSFLNTIKIVFFLAFLVSAFTMYVLSKEFWGKLGGVLSAVFYVWAPYHIVDVYVRGAMNEAWALAWFPAILWAIYKIIKVGAFRYVAVLSLYIGLLALSHNPMMMVFVPGALLWGLFWMWQEKKFFDKFLYLKFSFSGIWGLGMSAFFTLPVVFEAKYAHLETLVSGYFNYLAHFLSLKQLFINRDWGYGASFWGTEFDGMSFQIGHLHWIVSFLVLVTAFVFRKTKARVSLLILFFFFFTYGYTFMSHVRATPVWQMIKPLEFMQFPWRLLSFTILGTSFLAGSIVLFFEHIRKRLLGIVLTFLLIAGVIFINKDYPTWREYYPDMRDEKKFSGELWQLQVTSGIFDYLPIGLPLPPAKGAISDASFMGASGTYNTISKKSNFQKYVVEISDKGTFVINTFYFPGWRIFVDEKEVEIDPTRNKELGLMLVDLSAGRHEVVARFMNTPVRTVANSLSIISWLIFVVFVLKSLKVSVRPASTKVR